VIAAGRTVSGCTIHWVTANVDEGGVVLQKQCAVEQGNGKRLRDTPETLKAKVQKLEGEAFLEALAFFEAGKIGPSTLAADVGAASSDMLTFIGAGIDIEVGNALVERIRPTCKTTERPGYATDLGGFGGLFDLSAAHYGASSSSLISSSPVSEPGSVLLVGATAGVGTKLKVAQIAGVHDYVGIDLVAMCTNDLLAQGAEPLFFLDYFATGKLSVAAAASIVEGIAEGCRRSNCGLIGGETAEMPSMYGEGEYDLGGFGVGAVRKRQLLPRPYKPALAVAVNDVVLGLSSSGVHSSGFSLMWQLMERTGISFQSHAPFDTMPPGQRLGEALLTPTKIYVRTLLPILRKDPTLIKAMTHITGGGLPENIPRALPHDLAATIDLTQLSPLPPVFAWLQKEMNLSREEMINAFNCGVGMIVLCGAERKAEAIKLLRARGEEPMVLGHVIVRNSKTQPAVVFNGELH
jgi:phosphoribosylaminoimidazole synthetase